MHQTFGTSSEVFGVFIADVVCCAVVLLVVVVLLVWCQRRNGSWRPVAALALAGFSVVAWSLYNSTYGHFIEAEAADTGLRLRFAGLMRRDVTIFPEAIDTVLFGLPGKSNHQCYFRVVLKNGDSFRSSEIDLAAAECKKLRQQMLLALAGERRADQPSPKI